jgi:hypothetical protein
MDAKGFLMRHFLAALAYCTQKALRGAQPSFASFRAAPQVRTPHELVRHMSGVLNYARTFFGGDPSLLETLPDFEAEIARFHQILEELGEHLLLGTPLRDVTPEQLPQQTIWPWSVAEAERGGDGTLGGWEPPPGRDPLV